MIESTNSFSFNWVNRSLILVCIYVVWLLVYVLNNDFHTFINSVFDYLVTNGFSQHLDEGNTLIKNYDLNYLDYSSNYLVQIYVKHSVKNFFFLIC